MKPWDAGRIYKKEPKAPNGRMEVDDEDEMIILKRPKKPPVDAQHFKDLEQRLNGHHTAQMAVLERFIESQKAVIASIEESSQAMKTAVAASAGNMTAIFASLKDCLASLEEAVLADVTLVKNGEERKAVRTKRG